MPHARLGLPLVEPWVRRILEMCGGAGTVCACIRRPCRVYSTYAHLRPLYASKVGLGFLRRVTCIPYILKELISPLEEPKEPELRIVAGPVRSIVVT